MKILLDTSFLMIPGNFGVDFVSQIREKYPEAEFYTITGVVRELQGLVKGTKPGLKGKHKKAARLALEILKKRPDIQVILSEGKVDDILIETRNYIPATLDARVISELRKLKREYFCLIKNKYISLEM